MNREDLGVPDLPWVRALLALPLLPPGESQCELCGSARGVIEERKGLRYPTRLCRSNVCRALAERVVTMGDLSQAQRAAVEPAREAS